MTAAHAVGSAHSATVGVGAPPGVMPSGGQPYVPSPSQSAPVAAHASASGLYDPSASAVAPKKKSSAGLIIAILAVLAVGGGVAAFVILGQKDDKGARGRARGPTSRATIPARALPRPRARGRRR